MMNFIIRPKIIHPTKNYGNSFSQSNAFRLFQIAYQPTSNKTYVFKLSNPLPFSCWCNVTRTTGNIPSYYSSVISLPPTVLRDIWYLIFEELITVLLYFDFFDILLAIQFDLMKKRHNKSPGVVEFLHKRGVQKKYRVFVFMPYSKRGVRRFVEF